MHKRIILTVAALLCGAAVLHGETIQLPYQSPDNSGNQWIVYAQGNLQQQGNQPIFSQAGMITVNGQQPTQNNQQAEWEPATKELTLKFQGRGNRNLVNHTRRMQFNEDTGIVRIIDVFENTRDVEQPVNINITSSTNFGVNDATLITDPKDKKLNIGWAANTGAGRTAMVLMAGKASKLAPSIRYQPGNNQCSTTYTLKVPANKQAAIVHWYGSFDTSDAAVAWAEQLNESKALADVPKELRREILNVRANAGTQIGEYELLRGRADADVVELTTGDPMRGTLEAGDYVLATRFGDITLKAQQLVGILNVGAHRPRQLLVTTEGEIIGGQLREPNVAIKLQSGQITKVPLSQIARIGFKTPDVEPVEWTLDQPMAFLTRGERCRITPPAEAFKLVTRYGTVELTPLQVATILFNASGEPNEVFLTDGSRLGGAIDRANWALTLASTGTSVPVDSGSIRRLQYAMLAQNVGADLPSVALSGSDVVSARIDGELKITTPFDTLTLAAGEVSSIVRTGADNDAQVTMVDQSVFRGVIEGDTVLLKLVAGPELSVPWSAVREYNNPRPLPAPLIVTRVAETIAKLDNADFNTREQAEAQLLAFGPSILGALQEALPRQSPEAKERVQTVIKKLTKDQPAAVTKLVPLPMMEQ